MISLGSAE